MAIGKKTGGRTKGTLNKATVEKRIIARDRQELAIASGATPLEVIIADMRFHYEAALIELGRGLAADPDKVAARLTAARNAAKDAAPYIHPRLAAVEHTGKDGGPIALTHAREQLAHLIALEATAGGAGEDPPTAH